MFRLARPWSPQWVGLRHKPHLAAALLHEVATLRANRRAVDAWVGDQTFDVVYGFGMSLIGGGVTEPLSRRGVPVFWHLGGGYLESRFVRAPVESVFLRLRRRWLAVEDRLDFRYVGFVSRHLERMCEDAGFFAGPGAECRRRFIVARGVDFARRADVERQREQPPVILMAGRILSIKGFHLAVEAASQLHRRRPDLAWILRIVGEPDRLDVDQETGDGYYARLQGLVDQLGLASRVEFAGRRSRAELLELMAGATVFVSASTCGEGFANTIIESMGSGTALVASIDGSSLEQVVPNESALVYDAHDVPALSHHLESLLADSDLRLKIARGGVERIRSCFTLDRVLDQTEHVLGEIVRDNQEHPRSYR